MFNLFEKALTIVQTEKPTYDLRTQFVLATFAVIKNRKLSTGRCLSLLKLYKLRPDVEGAVSETVSINRNAVLSDLRFMTRIVACDRRIKNY